MEDNIRLKVIGILNDLSGEDGDDTIEFLTTGKWVIKNGKDHIMYNDTELIDNSVTKTRVTIDNNTVSIIRSGGSNTHLIFEKGISHIIPYETPFGMLKMTSTTNDIILNRTGTSIEVKVIYRLEMDQTDMGQNVFHIIGELL